MFSILYDNQQGTGTETFQKVGLDLPKPVFARGQLYVALSRATTEEGVRVKLQQSEEQGFHNGMVFTKNVINPDIIHFPKSPFSKNNTSLPKNLPKK